MKRNENRRKLANPEFDLFEREARGQKRKVAAEQHDQEFTQQSKKQRREHTGDQDELIDDNNDIDCTIDLTRQEQIECEELSEDATNSFERTKSVDSECSVHNKAMGNSLFLDPLYYWHELNPAMLIASFERNLPGVAYRWSHTITTT